MKLYILVISNCRFAPHTLGAPAIRGTPPTLKKPYMILNLGTAWV